MTYAKNPKRQVAADYLQRYIDDNFSEQEFIGDRSPGADLIYPGQTPDFYPTPVIENTPAYPEEGKPLLWI
jgi:hypothetical protein